MPSPKKRSSQKAFTLKNSRRETRSPKKANYSFSIAQKVVLVVIAATAGIIIGFTVFAMSYDAKAQVEYTISRLAKSYYEDYYYPSAFEGDEALAANFLSRYTKSGLSAVSLRQLILSAPAITPKSQALLEKYCDPKATYVTFIPESPYRSSSYQTKFNYSCNFE